MLNPIVSVWDIVFLCLTDHPPHTDSSHPSSASFQGIIKIKHPKSILNTTFEVNYKLQNRHWRESRSREKNREQKEKFPSISKLNIFISLSTLDFWEWEENFSSLFFWEWEEKFLFLLSISENLKLKFSFILGTPGSCNNGVYYEKKSTCRPTNEDVLVTCKWFFSSKNTIITGPRCT